MEFKQLNENIQMRVVIKFMRHTFKFWIHQDEGGHTLELDLEKRQKKRQKEFQFHNDRLDMLPLEVYDEVYDTQFKEGRFGFFCTQCNGLALSNIQFWADECDIAVKDGYSNLVSQFSAW